MNRPLLALLPFLSASGLALAAACGGTSSALAILGDDGGSGGSDSSTGGDGSTPTTGGDDGGPTTTGGDSGPSSGNGDGSTGGNGCNACPAGFSCGSGTVCKSPAGVPAFGNVYLIVEENHSFATVKGATYIASLIAANASTSAYKDTLVHPSLPNYLGITSGSTHGVTCDCLATSDAGAACGASCNAISGLGCSCDQPASVANVADEIEAKGLSWHAYGEDMGGPCDGQSHGNYVPRHVPFVYYDSIQLNATRCANVVPFTNFAADLGKYNFNFIAPNLCDDGHNTCAPENDQVKQTDDWLSKNVPTITGAPGFQKNGVLFITWDEGDESFGGVGPTDDNVLLIIVSPLAKQTVTAQAYNHYSLLGTIEEGLGLAAPHLGTAPIADVWK